MPAPADGASGRPLRGVPAASAAPLGMDGGSTRRAPGAAASGTPAAVALAGAAGSSARRGASGTTAAAAPSQPPPFDENQDAPPAVARRDREVDPWDRPASPVALGRPAEPRAGPGRGEGAAARSQVGGSGFAAVRGSTGGSDDATTSAAAAAAITTSVRGTAARRGQAEDPRDRPAPSGAPGHPAAVRAVAGREVGGVTYQGGGPLGISRGDRPPDFTRGLIDGGQRYAAASRTVGPSGDAEASGDGDMEHDAQPPLADRDPTWGEDYDYDSWDRGDDRAPPEGAATAISASAQARGSASASGSVARLQRGAVVAQHRGVYGGAGPNAREAREGRAAGTSVGAWRDTGGYGGDRGDSSCFPAGLLVPRTPVRSRVRVESRTAGRSGLEVVGFEDHAGDDNPPYEHEVLVVDEDPSPASYHSSRQHSARRVLDPPRGQRLGFGPQNVDPRAIAELVNSGGALAVLSRKRARVEPGEYYSQRELRGLDRDVVAAILGTGRTELSELITEDEYWHARFKRSKEAKAVADAGANAGFDPNHDPFKNFHRFSFTQPLELGGPLDPKKMSKLVHSTTLFYQEVPSDVSSSAAFQNLLTKSKTLTAELKVDIARVRAAGGSLSCTIVDSVIALMTSFFTLRASVMGELSKELPVDFAFRTQGLMVCWCFQKLSDDMPHFLNSLRDAISTEARSRQNAGESGDRFSAESWYTILSGFLAGMAGVRPFQPPTFETDVAAGRASSAASPAFYTVNVPVPAVGQGAFVPGFGGLAAPVMYSTVGQPIASLWTTQASAAVLPPPPPPPPSSQPPSLPQAPANGYWTQSSAAPGHGGWTDTRSSQRPVAKQAPPASGGGHGAGASGSGAPGGASVRSFRTYIPSSPSMIGSLSPYREDVTIGGVSCYSCNSMGHYSFECPRAMAIALGEPPPGWMADGSKDLAAWDPSGRELTPSSMEAYVRYIERHRLVPSPNTPVPPDVFASGVPPATAQRPSSRGGAFSRGRGRGR